MKIHKVRPWRWGDRHNNIEADFPRYIIGREVGFDELDFNRVRGEKKNCILDYKLIKWEHHE
jgi:hypothetical protein